MIKKITVDNFKLYNQRTDFDHLRLLGLAMAVLMCLSAVGTFVAQPLAVMAGLGQLVAWFFFYRDATALLNGLAKTENS